jgi:hypothetical protein
MGIFLKSWDFFVLQTPIPSNPMRKLQKRLISNYKINGIKTLKKMWILQNIFCLQKN